MTASNSHIYTKVATLLRKTGQPVKPKVTPLLAKLLMPEDLSKMLAIQWGCNHEDDTQKAFFSSEVSKQVIVLLFF